MFFQRIAIVALICCGSSVALAADKEPAVREGSLAWRLARHVPEIAFSGQELGDVIDFMRDVTGTNIFVNWRALETIDIKHEAPVTLRLTDQKFEDCLSGIMAAVATKKGKPKFTVEDGVIFISADADPKKPFARVTAPVIPEKQDFVIPEINFAGQGLSDVLDFLKDVSKLKTAPDWDALKKAGITKESPATPRLRDIKFSTALKIVLESVSDGKMPIVCTFKDGEVTITTEPKAEKTAK